MMILVIFIVQSRTEKLIMIKLITFVMNMVVLCANGPMTSPIKRKLFRSALQRKRNGSHQMNESATTIANSKGVHYTHQNYDIKETFKEQNLSEDVGHATIVSIIKNSSSKI